MKKTSVKTVVSTDKPKRVYKKKTVEPKEEPKEEIKEEQKEEDKIVVKYPNDELYKNVHDIEFPELKEKIKQLLNL